jgi:transketolase
MAIAAKYDGKPYRIYSIHGDGELQEGSIWEAAMSAAHYKLDNLTALVDRNMVQIDGRTSDVMELEPLSQKWRSFGWNVIECNGNDHGQVADAYSKAMKATGQPSVIIARTRMGYGLPSIENDHHWHGKAPSPKQEAEFLKELEINFNG